MRYRIGAAALALGLASLGTTLGAAVNHATPHQRAFQFTYTAQITDLPAQAHLVRVWVPLAKTRANQQVLARRITTAHPYEIHVEPTSGNEILYVTLTAPVPQTFTVEIAYDALVREDRRAFQASLSGALQRDLDPNALVIIDETVKHFSAEATTGRATDVERARGIYDFVVGHMSYDKTTPGWGHGDTRRACLIGKGNCTDFHSLFISMARAAGLPARFVIGAPIPQTDEGPIAGYHCWAEVYTREQGWIPVDTSEAWKHPELKEYYFGTPDPNKLLISVGRDLELVPRQQGEPLNFFLEPYVEVDGQPIRTVHTQFYFRSQPYKEGSG